MVAINVTSGLPYALDHGWLSELRNREIRYRMIQIQVSENGYKYLFKTMSHVQRCSKVLQVGVTKPHIDLRGVTSVL